MDPVSQLNQLEKNTVVWQFGECRGNMQVDIQSYPVHSPLLDSVRVEVGWQWWPGLSVSVPSIYSDIMGKWKDIMGGLPRYANLCIEYSIREIDLLCWFSVFVPRCAAVKWPAGNIIREEGFWLFSLSLLWGLVIICALNLNREEEGAGGEFQRSPGTISDG